MNTYFSVWETRRQNYKLKGTKLYLHLIYFFGFFWRTQFIVTNSKHLKLATFWLYKNLLQSGREAQKRSFYLCHFTKGSLHYCPNLYKYSILLLKWNFARCTQFSVSVNIFFFYMTNWLYPLKPVDSACITMLGIKMLWISHTKSLFITCNKIVGLNRNNQQDATLW